MDRSQSPQNRPEDKPQPLIEGLADPSESGVHEDMATGSEGSGRTVGLGGYSEAEGHRAGRRRRPAASERSNRGS